MTKTGRILAYGSSGLLVLAGVGGAIVFSGMLGQVIAFVLISLGLVMATSLVFLEVGLSEDRERARTMARPPEAKRPRSRRPVPKLGRMRGRSRRLR